MRRFLAWLFKDPPEIGSVWTYSHKKGNPFLNPDDYFVVAEVKNNFVKYLWIGSVSGQPRTGSTSIREFRASRWEVKNASQPF